MALPERIANSPSAGTAAGLTTLSGSMTAVQATIPATAAAPSALQGTGQCRVLVDNELMIVDTSTVNGTTWTVITRGAEGTTATTHNPGATIYHVWTAGALQPSLYRPSVGVAQASSFTARGGTMNYCTGAITATLPSAPSGDVEIGILALTGTVTINRGGTDTIDQYQRTGLTAIQVPAGSMVTLKYLSGVWYLVRDTRPPGAFTVARAYVVTPTTFRPATVPGWNKIPLDTVSFDPGSNFNVSDTGTNPHAYTVPVAGWYHVSGQVDPGTGMNAVLGFYKNAGQVSVGEDPEVASSNSVGSDIIQCAAGDYLEMWANFWGTSNSLNYWAATSDSNYLSVVRVA